MAAHMGGVTHLGINEHSLPSDGILTQGFNAKRMFAFAINLCVEN